MKAREGLHVEWVDDEAVVLEPETGTLHYLNPQAAFVYALVLEVGVDEAVAQIADRHGDDIASTEVTSLLKDMTEKGLLQDE